MVCFANWFFSMYRNIWKEQLFTACSCLKIAFTYGDLNRVVFPVDSMGRICGIDSRVSDKPHAQFSDLAKCFDIGMPLFGCKTICVEKCPDTSFSFDKNRCRSHFNEIRDHLICHGDINKDEIRNCRDIEESINDRSCARWYLPSYSRKSFDWSIFPSFSSIIRIWTFALQREYSIWTKLKRLSFHIFSSFQHFIIAFHKISLVLLKYW